MDKYNFRGALFRYKRLMNFGKIGTKQSGVKIFSIFGEGPVLYIENNKIDTIFNILYLLQNPDPKRDVWKDFFIKNGIPESDGIYLIDIGGRKSVINTKNLANSMAKVIRDGLNADTKSDIFSIRIAKSKIIKFSILSFKANYNIAATYSGLHDTLNPNTAISDGSKTVNFRRYKGYKRGLEMCGHYSTLSIEKLLDDGIVPEFMSDKDISIWRDADFKPIKKITNNEYINYKYKLINEDS